MKRTRLAVPLSLAALAMASCSVTVLEDLEVSWTIDGSDAADLCDTYGIASWAVSADGPARWDINPDVNCVTEDWVAFFDGIDEGSYTVTVTALDASGGVLASKSGTGVTGIPGTIALTFTEADFGVATMTKIDILWNINGTLDENDPETESWDTCDEVGAETAVVTIADTEYEFDCDASGNMAGMVNVEEGTYTVEVRLVDSAGADLTSVVTQDITATVDEPGWLMVDFYWEAFLDDFLGDFLFGVLYEGELCSSENLVPLPHFQMTMLKLKGDDWLDPAPQICGGETFDACDYFADGADTMPCDDNAMKIKELTWGEYLVNIKGTLDDTTGYETCWETQDGADDVVSVRVGAGVDNPQQDIDLVRISTTGNCEP